MSGTMNFFSNNLDTTENRIKGDIVNFINYCKDRGIGRFTGTDMNYLVEMYYNDAKREYNLSELGTLCMIEGDGKFMLADRAGHVIITAWTR